MNKRTAQWTAETREVRAITAEAAAWLARLHSDGCDERDVAAFRIWLAENQAHQDAFARVTDAWEAAGGLAGECGDPMGTAGSARPPETH